MVPPFLAYYGALSGNSSLLQGAYHQCNLYPSALKSSSGLWQHIVMGNAPDPGNWETGNGWAAMGMLYVYATLRHSSLASHFSSKQRDLANWIAEIYVGLSLTSPLQTFSPIISKLPPFLMLHPPHCLPLPYFAVRLYPPNQTDIFLLRSTYFKP